MSDKQYVYLIKSQNYYKIGRSKNPPQRMRKLAGALPPVDPELVHVIDSKDPRRLERALHALFANKHVKGEWFVLMPEDIDVIKRITPENEQAYISRASKLFTKTVPSSNFPGRNFREREQIKRLCLRWTARFSRMPTAVREVLLAHLQEAQSEANSRDADESD